MCGIAGIFGALDEAAVRRMNEAQESRGPDDEGLFVDPETRAVLGQRRLSILDLSPAGHQPMRSRGGRYVLVYNGELYNFRELREELRESGRVFRSDSDTEVVLEAYQQWGPACLERFEGMFALALLDRGPAHGPGASATGDADPYLFLARDRLGIKPLVYARLPGCFVFASELGALLASGRVARRADPQAIAEYLTYGAVQQPRTVLREVLQLAPGSSLVVRRGGAPGPWRRYWDLIEATRERRRAYAGLPYAELVERTAQTLREATARHLVADVPVGLFLSGGVDSGALAALMSQQGAKPVQSFTVGFGPETREVADERSAAARIARELGCVHREIVVGDREIAALFPRVVRALDQPSIDGTNTWLVSRIASQSVKVAISGLGGDELFAGYAHFRLASGREGSRLGSVSAALQRALPGALGAHAAARFASDADRMELARRHLSGWRWHLGRGHVLPARAPRSRLARDACAADPSLDPVARTSLFELRGYLLSTLLRDADATSMAHGLELRPVLLDRALVEHAFALPAQAKLRDGRPKAAFVDAVAPLFGERRALEGPKLGFELPFGRWLNGPLREPMREALANPLAAEIFSRRHLGRLGAKLRAGTLRRNEWSFLVLVQWLATQRVEPS